MCPTRRVSVAGFTLIELMIGVAVMAILLALAIPAANEWMANSRLRNQAESVISGLRLARGEALKRNAMVRFQLVTDTTNGCAVTGASNLWQLSHGDPTASCGLPEDIQAPDTTNNNPYAVPPVILLNSSQLQLTSTVTTITVVANGLGGGVLADSIACFTGTGALARINNASGLCTGSMNPATSSPATVTIDISDPGAGTCFNDFADPATGNIRCLRVQVSSWGDIRMCDPGLAPAKHVNDPRICT